MAELERMVTQKVQSLHERVKQKEDAFRVSAHAQSGNWHSQLYNTSTLVMQVASILLGMAVAQVMDADRKCCIAYGARLAAAANFSHKSHHIVMSCLALEP